MNGQQNFAALQEKRPPAVGREVTNYDEKTSQPNLELCASVLKNRMEQKESTEQDCNVKGDLADSYDKATLASSESMAPDESMERSPQNPSPPPPYKWAQSLQCLLDDSQGVELFQRFLVQEGQDKKCLDFLFACRGVKKVDLTDSEHSLHRLVRAVYDKKVKRINAISEETKREIKRKISRTEIDVNIFDDAQRQVEMDIINTTYPNFLQSDLYIQHLRTLNESLQESDYPVSPAEPECLPTLHEDSELHFSDKNSALKKENLRNRFPRAFANQSLKNKAEAGAYLKSPYSSNYGSYHARYGSFLPTSAQDSELQSLSSEAMTDDTLSQANSSLDFPMSRSKDKRPMKNRHMYLNRDSLNQHSIIPRTQRYDMDQNKGLSVNEFYEQLVKKLNKVAEEQKVKERVNEKLKIIEVSDCSRPEAIGSTNQKTNKPNEIAFDSAFLFGPVEENDQAILDRHVSRVFDHTPVLSPGCISPPVATSQAAQDLPRAGLTSPFAVVPNAKPKREHDTRSSDSGAVTEWRSDDNLTTRSQDNSSGVFMRYGSAAARFSRESLKRSGRRACSINDSASSCVDSGISEVCEPVLPSYSKVAHWLETKAEKEWKNSPTSLPDANLSQKSNYGNHLGTTDVMIQSYGAVISRSAVIAPQPMAQDFSMSGISFPDTTTNLLEARKRLEDERIKVMKSRHATNALKNRPSFRTHESVVEEGLSHRKQSKKSPVTAENSVSTSNNDVTVIGYSYGQGAVPYLTRFHGKNVTLKNFKSLLTKKGNFKYYFKKVENAFGTGTVLEEVSDDHAVLPLWEGKVFCVIESVDDISTSLED